MICGILELENVVQISDKTRLSALKSFVSKGEFDITKVEIQPENAAGYIDVTDTDPRNWFLDWIYTGATRVVTVSLRVTSNPGDPDADPVVDAVVSTVTKTIQIYTATDDALFSSDKDLMAIEPDILKWVPDGRASWLNVHRAAQEKILDWMNKAGITDMAGLPLTKAAVVDVDEVRFWSRDLCLAIIFKGIQNLPGDVFSEKAKFYFTEASKASDRAKLRLDIDGDGTLGPNDSVGLTSAELIRR